MTTLSVRGEASLEVLADHVLLTVQVSRSDPDRALATASAAEAADALRAAVAATAGVRTSALSRVRVVETSEWDDRTRTTVRTGWQATLGGRVDVEAASAGDVVGAVVDAGAEVVGADWRPFDDNPVHREVRRLAVVAAGRAAADFADALGGSLGELVELADAGLLSGSAEAEPRLARMLVMGSGAGSIDVDPQLLTVRAVVDARYLLTPG